MGKMLLGKIKGHWKINRLILGGMLFGVLAFLFIGNRVLSAFDETAAVHVKADDIEPSTLVIGTHLIHISALTDEIYDIAKESAEESGQDRIYYKSELAENTWYDITEASSLEDITTGGTPVEASVIEELFFTHHTKSDGITYDLRTGETVSVFDIRSPYDLESMEELQPLKNQFDLMMEMTVDDADTKKNIERVDKFFATEVTSEVTKECDTDLSSLQVYLNTLNEYGASKEEIAVVSKVMGKIDAKRRAAVFEIVESALMDLTNQLTGISSGEQSSESSETESPSGDFTTDSDLLSAVNDSLSNVLESLTTEQGNMLSEGSSVMTKVEYDLSLELINNGNSKNDAACDGTVQKLIALDNILNGNIVSQTNERNLLYDTLMKKGEEVYVNGISAGINSDYKAALDNNSSYVYLNSIAEENTGNLNVYRNELEFFIDAVCERLTNEEAIDYINQRIEITSGFYSKVPEDAFKTGGIETIDAHMDWLTDKLNSLLEASGESSDLDLLLADKEDLQEQKLEALDDNDLEKAKEIDALLDAKEEEIQEEETSIANQLDDLNAKKEELKEELESTDSGDTDTLDDLNAQIADLNADITKINSEISDGSLAKQIADLKDKALDLIGDGSGDTSELTDIIDSLGSFLDTDASLAYDALKEIYQSMVSEKYLKDEDGFDDLIGKIENLAADSKAALAGTLTEEDLEEIIDNADLGAQKGIIALIALNQYYDQTGNENAKSLIYSRSRTEMNKGNPLIFIRVEDPSLEFLPMQVISSYTGFRYLWNENLKKATLADSSSYYEFTAFDTRVVRNRQEDKTEDMTTAAAFQSTIHIGEDYTLVHFGCEAVYLTGTKYGVLSDGDINDKAEELVQAFLEKGEE